LRRFFNALRGGPRIFARLLAMMLIVRARRRVAFLPLRTVWLTLKTCRKPAKGATSTTGRQGSRRPGLGYRLPTTVGHSTGCQSVRLAICSASFVLGHTLPSRGCRCCRGQANRFAEDEEPANKHRGVGPRKTPKFPGDFDRFNGVSHGAALGGSSGADLDPVEGQANRTQARRPDRAGTGHSAARRAERAPDELGRAGASRTGQSPGRRALQREQGTHKHGQRAMERPARAVEAPRPATNLESAKAARAKTGARSRRGDGFTKIPSSPRPVTGSSRCDSLARGEAPRVRPGRHRSRLRGRRRSSGRPPRGTSPRKLKRISVGRQPAADGRSFCPPGGRRGRAAFSQRGRPSTDPAAGPLLCAHFA